MNCIKHDNNMQETKTSVRNDNQQKFFLTIIKSYTPNVCAVCAVCAVY